MPKRDFDNLASGQGADLVSEPDLAQRWKKSARTMQRLRGRGEVPPWLVIGHSIFYRKVDILDFECRARLGTGS